MERGRVLKCVLRGRGPAPSTTTTSLGGGAADGKPQGRGGEGWRGRRGSPDLLRHSCFFLWQLLPITSPLEKGYPCSPGPRPSLAVWLGVGGSEAGDVQMSKAHLSPTCCCWRRGTVISASLRPERGHPSVSPRDLYSRSPTPSPAPWLGGEARAGRRRSAWEPSLLRN